MKTLYLVRHAKSSWDNPGLSDFERPLNKRGNHDAPLMGKVLKERGINPDLILTSPAVRTLKTAQYFAEALEFPKNKIKKIERLYEAGLNEIIWVIQNTENKHDSLMLFGHNPGITVCVNYLSNNIIDNMVTSSIFSIKFEIATWMDINKKSAIFDFYEYPKKYK